MFDDLFDTNPVDLEIGRSNEMIKVSTKSQAGLDFLRKAVLSLNQYVQCDLIAEATPSEAARNRKKKQVLQSLTFEASDLPVEAGCNMTERLHGIADQIASIGAERGLNIHHYSLLTLIK